MTVPYDRPLQGWRSRAPAREPVRARRVAWAGSRARLCGTGTPASRAGAAPYGAGSAVRAPGPDRSAQNQMGRCPLVRGTEQGSHRLEAHDRTPRPSPPGPRTDPTMRRGAGRRRGLVRAGVAGGVTLRPTPLLPDSGAGGSVAPGLIQDLLRPQISLSFPS